METIYTASCDTCGFHTHHRYQAYVDRALRVHSCEKWLRRAAAEARRAEREKTIDRTPKPCHHKQANHQHGTRAAYVLDGCRCIPCNDANNQANDQWRRAKAYGRYDKYVDAEPIRAHVTALREAGLGTKTIASRTGVSHGAMWKLMYGKRQSDGTLIASRRVLRTTAEKLLALDVNGAEPIDLLAGGTVLDHDSSMLRVKRLQALVALGWSMSEIGRQLGLHHVRNAIPVIKGERDITVHMARRADALFNRLCMSLPVEDTAPRKIAASRARNFAKAHGWPPPLALDDLAPYPLDDEDDGTSWEDSIDEAMVLRKINDRRTPRRLTRAEAAEVVRRLRLSGKTTFEIENVWGLKPERYPRKEAS